MNCWTAEAPTIPVWWRYTGELKQAKGAVGHGAQSALVLELQEVQAHEREFWSLKEAN